MEIIPERTQAYLMFLAEHATDNGEEEFLATVIVSSVDTFYFCSLRRRRNLTSVSNVCEAAPRSLYLVPNGLNELPEVRFEFPIS